MLSWLTTNRTATYLLLNATVLITVITAAQLQQAPFGHAAWVIAMVMTCSAPLLLLEKINGPYAMLAIFLTLYFSFFASLDLLTLLVGASFPVTPQAGFMTAAETGILLGGLLALLSYMAGVRLAHTPMKPDSGTTDWPQGTLLAIGLTLWIVGTTAIVYFQVFASPEKTNFSVKRGLAAMGPVLTFIVLLATLVQPLGLLMLSYGYAKFRSLQWRVLIVAVMLIQVSVAFITDIKGIAIMGGMLVIVVKTLVDQKLPKAWLAAGLAFLVFGFPVFQAYRAEVAGVRGMNRAQALENIGKSLQIALAARDKVMDNTRGGHAPNFFERLSSKENVELIFERVGIETPYLHGETLVAIPLAFVPRLILPDKRDVAAGQKFGKVFFKADSDVYISLSYLGELYWNFGWAGVIVGMTLYGLLLGVIGARSDLSQSMSITRLLVLMATTQGLCMGFGGSIATSSITWIRSLAAIGLLHLLLARRREPEAKRNDQPFIGPLLPIPAGTRFRNVLR